MTRQIILDTETTGLEPKEGHRIIEIGCIELIKRRLTGNYFQAYLNPDREVDQGALNVHGISNEFLANKPRFPEVYEKFIAFISGAELIIHNAPFDIGFLNHEFLLLGETTKHIQTICKVIDTLQMARKMHPGQRNSLDALCKRYQVDNTDRDYHGALLDAKILAHVYLAMTSGQSSLFDSDFHLNKTETSSFVNQPSNITSKSWDLPVHYASKTELETHQDYMVRMKKMKDESI